LPGYQLKYIFHALKSAGSAGIESNNTTVAEYVETKLEAGVVVSPNTRETQSIEQTMTFIEENVRDYPINRERNSQKVVEGLDLPLGGEGDLTLRGVSEEKRHRC